jgi:outer membrane lipoprotein-sorting protein
MSLLRLLLIFLMSLSPAMASESILDQAVEQFQAITSYSTTMRSFGKAEHIINYRYKKPGYVRMDFVKPHKGAALVYRPETGKVQLRPFGFIKSIALTMEPTSKLVRSPSGHRVDESDIGVLLENAQNLAEQGSLEVLREETIKQTTMVVLEITGEENVLVDGVHRYLLWMDKKLKLPRIVESYDNENQLIESLFLDDLILNPEFAEIFDL